MIEKNIIEKLEEIFLPRMGEKSKLPHLLPNPGGISAKPRHMSQCDMRNSAVLLDESEKVTSFGFSGFGFNKVGPNTVAKFVEFIMFLSLFLATSAKNLSKYFNTPILSAGSIFRSFCIVKRISIWAFLRHA